MPRRNLIALLTLALVSWLCYQRASRNRYAATLTEAMNVVTSRYINDVESRVLFEGAMDGMIGKLDPYSAYTSPEAFDRFQQQMDGEFTGIGIAVEIDSTGSRLTVLDALVGKPAYLKGIRAGDVLLAIDGKETKDLPIREAVGLIRGRPGTKVRIRVQHSGGGEPIEYELERATIPLETVLGDARGKDGKWVFHLLDHPRIGYIRIFDNFGERTAAEFRAALASYRQPDESIDGLMIDLRYNAGGLLPAAIDVCDMLLDDGLIVTTRGRHDVVTARYEATAGTELLPGTPLVVLVDRLSASASEIVAACLQDHHRAAIAGQRTWGKGTVQNVILLEGGRSAIRLTVGSYRRPSGNEIHKWKDAKESDDWGVRPDEGLEVLLTNHQNDLIVHARRRRDLTPWEVLQAAVGDGHPQEFAPQQPSPSARSASPPASSPIPALEPDTEVPADQPPAAAEADASAAARRDPASIDPQLRKALEYLQQEISRRASGPGKA